MTPSPKSDYNEYPRTLARDDFWGQVRRTINGTPIEEADVQRIVQGLRTELALSPDDVVLDLACGNGALSSRLFDDCAGLLGVDLSAYLIEIAQENFAAPGYAFRHGDVVSYVQEEPDPARFTKALCYGSMMFLSPEQLQTMLAGLHTRFVALRRVTLGNVPDRELAPLFLEHNPTIAALDLDDPQAQAGRWWATEELAALAARCGWATAQVDRLDPQVFNARYRYDMTLSR